MTLPLIDCQFIVGRVKVDPPVVGNHQIIERHIKSALINPFLLFWSSSELINYSLIRYRFICPLFIIRFS
jgi:hypothetical protein